MKDYPSILLAKKREFIILIFILGFLVRLFLIFYHKGQDENIDLSIYRETGQLVNHGVNPYDFEDGAEIRNQLRIDSIAFDAYVSESQANWDYYTSSNLPLSTLYYALIDKISNHPKLYRIIFSLFDAILAALIALILLQWWPLKKTWADLILLAGLSAFSPAMLYVGNVLPEDKSLQTLLILASIYLAKEKKWVVSAVLLGLSVAFKGLGVFIAPFALYLVLDEPANIFRLKSSQIWKGLAYTTIALLAAVVWFLPYMPGIITMMQTRLSSNIDVEPGHASIWTILYEWFPNGWVQIKDIFVATVTVIWFYYFVIRRFNLAAVCLFLLVLFVDVMLLQGSLDRMNIGIMVSLILFCFVDIRYAKFLAWYTIIIGGILYAYFILIGSSNETIDALYTTGYLIIFLSYPVYGIFAERSINTIRNEA